MIFFSPNRIGISSCITDLALFFQSLKGRCHGNQPFLAKIGEPSFIRHPEVSEYR